ncbi:MULTISPECIES: DUF3658 domain-containing protein [Burkholderia]|nr:MULTISPECIES: DUF3658 domain-containing protein [Burkholderia]
MFLRRSTAPTTTRGDFLIQEATHYHLNIREHQGTEMNHETDRQPAIHITFSEYSLDTVSSAISSGELSGSCILVAGNWHLGPLKERNDPALAEWFSEHFGYVPDNVTIGDTSTAVKNQERACAWVNPTSSEEYANFLHWASICKLRNISLIRFSAQDIHPIGMARLAVTAPQADPNEIELYAREWANLVEENADFRLLNPSGKLRSFSASHFDKYITGATSNNWTSSPEVVLHIMETLGSEHQDFPGDIFLYHRIEKFVTSGIVEKQTDSDVTQTKIRSTSR